MFYVQEITIPANTPEAAALTFDYRIANGVIHRVELEFEKWCANLLHVQIFRFGQKIYPLTPLASFSADGETISFNDYFEVFETPYKLWVRAWNDDDFFPWSCRIRVGVYPEGVARHMFGKLGKTDRQKLLEAFGMQPEDK